MNWEWKDYVGQALCIFATLLTFLSYQVNKKNQVLAVQTVATVSMCVGYFFLGATSGFAMNIVGVTRNLTFYAFGETKAGVRKYWIASVVFSVAMCVLGALSWQGWYSLFIIVPLVVNTFFLALGDPQVLRKSILLTSSSFFVYNYFAFSIGGMVNEVVAIVSSIVGIIRFRKKKTEK